MFPVAALAYTQDAESGSGRSFPPQQTVRFNNSLAAMMSKGRVREFRVESRYKNV
ncbi:MAG: hypothetical protein RLY14_1561 [Planctomycetota bacterium]|jgi:hypothetical protein